VVAEIEELSRPAMSFSIDSIQLALSSPDSVDVQVLRTRGVRVQRRWQLFGLCE
jgi:hypothetical protein